MLLQVFQYVTFDIEFCFEDRFVYVLIDMFCFLLFKLYVYIENEYWRTNHDNDDVFINIW